MARLIASALAFLRMPPGERAAPLPWRVVAGVAAAIFASFAALSFTEAGRALELRGFDTLSVAYAPGRSQLPITLVGIDEASFAEVGRQWPWPRSLHAKLIDQLKKSGALVIAFDIVLSEASTETEDRALAEAIERSGNVVMAADNAYQETAYIRQWIRVDPLPAFRRAGASAGLATVALDRDLVVRQLPDGHDVFWREIVRRANALSGGMIPEPAPKPKAMIRFAGPDHTFPFVSYYQALAADTHLPPDAFRDQIVIVGRDVKASTDAQAAQADLFATPFTARTGWLTPGAEIHANILENAISGRAVVPVGQAWYFALLALVTALSSVLMRLWRPLGSLAVALVLVAPLGALSAWLYESRSLWLPVVSAMSCVAVSYLVYGAVGFLAERRRRAEVKRAFELYVAPEIVDHMLAQPGRLKFGGERRVITVLFTDLKGFTTISEMHGPEVVASVLQQHFTRASAIVKRRRGTLTQFIGDAIMAMWGAPLDDPDHAANACLAAREMQADITELRKELVEQGLPEVFMRIGIHTCDVAVGNFGASDRFYYTAMGDGVNLASRLEGANKLFGTGILVSGATAEALPPGTPLREVSRIIVKGKSKPVDVFTFDEEAEVRSLTAEAIAAFGRKEWDAAEKVFRSILGRREGDGVSLHYLEWIESMRAAAPGADWDRSESLDKM
jgi:adenylate cyclase